MPLTQVPSPMLAPGTAGNGPAFSAYNSVAQTIANATWTKLLFGTEEFDTNSNYDNATNYRFTPTIAGYYQVNGCASFSTGTGIASIMIYKNGTGVKQAQLVSANASYGVMPNISAMLYLNGSTDYIELYIFQSSGASANTSVGNTVGYFQAALVRAA